MHGRRPTIHTVRAALRLPLPGRIAQESMAVRPRPGDRPDLPNPCPREGAVLLLLYRRKGRLVMPFTLRTDNVETHRGQISFPGGAREPHDPSFAHTALRETSEELGIPETAIEILGPLTPLYIPPSRFCVYPHVGYMRRCLRIRPDTTEVAQVIEAPLECLLDPAIRRVETHFREGQEYQVPMYLLGEHRVWGATAMILAEFLAMLHQAMAG